MNTVDALSDYLDRCVRRLRRYVWLKGAAMAALTALLLTVALTGIMSRVPASPLSLRGERLVLIAGIAAVFAVCLRRRPGRADAARRIEARLPAFSQQLLTFVDREQKHRGDPFLPLLADSALQTAAAFTPGDLIAGRRFAAVFMALLAAIVSLLFLIHTQTSAAVLWASRP